MKPAAVIHRHFFTVPEVAKILLGEYADDCDSWEMRVEDGDVIVDVVGPFLREVVPSNENHDASEQHNALGVPQPLKGGVLAQKAGILCAEKGFQTFLEVKTPEAAGEMIRQQCKIDSRAKLDHDEDAAKVFNEIAGKYALWLEGYD